METVLTQECIEERSLDPSQYFTEDGEIYFSMDSIIQYTFSVKFAINEAVKDNTGQPICTRQLCHVYKPIEYPFVPWGAILPQIEKMCRVSGYAYDSTTGFVVGKVDSEQKMRNFEIARYITRCGPKGRVLMKTPERSMATVMCPVHEQKMAWAAGIKTMGNLLCDTPDPYGNPFAIMPLPVGMEVSPAALLKKHCIVVDPQL